ncbi:NRDE family protein [Algoriphagus aquimarinus]|uniref:NRDE family protein n=1 Tax=Algoriphagus aquimarinus TaxID=237018 RepID=A0A5C7AY63_9BACT|nr:NRDE family protein [Algoriphagus aquimarinus]TXE12593.1 NRDE family protein [Algoriphagus aquimarinus]
MCLVAFSWRTHPEYPLIISTNRDEFFERPTQAMHVWDSGIYAGKDLRSGGTWMGFHPNGRWSLLTNYRDFSNPRNAKISRGKLVQDWLENDSSAEEYLKEIQKNQDQYDGFNLLVSDGEKLFYLSNYSPDIQEVQPGIYGLSNGLLNDPWPKVELAKRQLEQLIKTEFSTNDLLNILKSKETYPPEKLPKTGIPLEMETCLSAQLIRMSGNYGTVSAAAVVQHKSGLVELKQRSFQWNAETYQDLDFQFQLDQT